MKDKKKTLIAMLAGIVVIAVLIVGYYWYAGKHFVNTENANIASHTVIVSPQISGRLTQWDVKSGDIVEAGEHMGWQDTGMMANSSAVNTGTLDPVGSMSISKAEITAPISGKVIKTYVQQGQMVSPGQTLAMIAGVDDLYVIANIEETEVNKIKLNDEVDVAIDALDGEKVQGKVEEIGEATNSTFSVLSASNASGNFTKVTQLVPVKIRIPGINEMKVVTGMNVEVKIHVG